jgi:glutamate carboxypeptidase
MLLTTSIEDYLRNNLSAYLDLLRQMVAINSFTANPEGVNRLSGFTAELFAGLGFQAEFTQSVNPHFGRHLVLTRQGEQLPSGSPAYPIGMISHLDTVFSPDEELRNDFVWRLEGKRIYGPGTVDIKGGTIMMYMVLDALRSFAQEVFERVTWILLLDASEEALSLDFTHLCLQRLPENTLACLVFEGGTNSSDIFPLVVARKGRAAYRVKVEGKSAHAGNYHANGANAILQMAHTIQKVAGLTDYKKQLTYNVGTVKGGSVINRVPHYAEASVEMRAFSADVFDAGVAAMLALDGSSDVTSADGYRCKVSVELGEKTAPWPPNPGTQRLFDLWEQAASLVGLRLAQEQRGGLSDGNMLWQHYPTLDGLGPAGNNAHCSERSPDGSKDQEYVYVGSFVPKALLNSLAIMKLFEGKFE